jgi:Poly(ADP-ribose) polymerase and DNA-Ligase Zn-finger region.
LIERLRDGSEYNGIKMAPRRSARLTQNAESTRPTANGALVEQSPVQKEEDSNTSHVQSRKNPKRARKNITEDVRTANRSKKVSNPKEPMEDEKKDDEIVEAEDMAITEDAKADSYSKNASSGKKRKTSAEQEPRKPDPEEVTGAPVKKKKTNKTSRVSNVKKDNAKVNKSISKAERQEAQMEREETVSFYEDEAGKPDGNGGLDNGSTYIIEYSKTSRATCKRCDIRINKNELRVGHRPLFRGKPGYQVFKHLHCIVFSEEIACAEDVAGYDGLTDDDYKALAKRVDESFKLIQKENEELEPDELVQKKFEGEMRGAPKGLAANLLPFQQEGVSWMYHQERNIEDVRGGILGK